MKRMPWIVALAVAGNMVTGCGNNAEQLRKACEATYDHMQSLECISEANKAQMTLESLCPDAILQSGCDFSEFYTCMSNLGCVDNLPDPIALAECSQIYTGILLTGPGCANAPTTLPEI